MTHIIMKRCYPDELVNIHVQSLINIIQANNRVTATKKGNGELPLICGNGERVIPIYGLIDRPSNHLSIWTRDSVWVHG